MRAAIVRRVRPSPDQPEARGGPASRVKVLHLLKVLEVGGAEQLVLWLTTLGDRTRFEYHVAHVVVGGSERLASQFAEGGVDVHSLGAASHYDLSWAGRFRSLVRAGHFDIVHLHLPYSASIGRLAVRSLPAGDRPLVVHTQHNLWEQTRPTTRLLHRLTYRLDDADLAVSHAVRWALPARLAARTRVLVHGIPGGGHGDSGSARSEVRAEFGIPDGQVLVVTVANLRKEKGYDVLLPAARSLIERGCPVRFVAVGDGPLAADIARRVAEMGLSERFTLTGYRPDARRILAGADIFVLASHFEGFPIAVMEALSEGVPVVSTRVGDVPDAVEASRAGLVVPSGDPPALAEALRSLVEDPRRRASIAANAAVAGESFDIHRSVSRLEEIYDSLLADRGGRSTRT